MGIEDRLDRIEQVLREIKRELEKPEPVPVIGRVLSANKVAEILGVTTRTVYGWAREGKLRSIHTGNRVLIPDTALQEFIERRDA